ncbi:MAG: chemotaxis protein CheR, partial [Rhodocyclaceae bacterium]|nr:chemotaxis protein CheR [Rhodocyclaceae bacterium]
MTQAKSGVERGGARLPGTGLTPKVGAGGTAMGAASPAPPPPREFRFTSEDFERVRRLIYRHAGIS